MTAKLNSTKSRKLKEKLLLRDGNICWICNKSFTETNPPTIDHFIPRCEEGSSNRQTNLKLAHAECNNKRGNPFANKMNPCLILETVKKILENQMLCFWSIDQ